MSLHWYACISTNTCCFEMHYISLETNWWALPNASLIVWIRSAVHEILADKAFTATDVLISQLFVVTFVHSTYVQIALIWGFQAQLSLWKSVHWLWRYKLNKVCDTNYPESGTMFFVGTFSLCTASTGAVNISSVSGVAGFMLWFDMLSLVILNDSSISSNTLIVSRLCPAVLSVCGFLSHCFVLSVDFFLHYTSLAR